MPLLESHRTNREQNRTSPWRKCLAVGAAAGTLAIAVGCTKPAPPEEVEHMSVDKRYIHDYVSDSSGRSFASDCLRETQYDPDPSGRTKNDIYVQEQDNGTITISAAGIEIPLLTLVDEGSTLPLQPYDQRTADVLEDHGCPLKYDGQPANQP